LVQMAPPPGRVRTGAQAPGARGIQDEHYPIAQALCGHRYLQPDGREQIHDVVCGDIADRPVSQPRKNMLLKAALPLLGVTRSPAGGVGLDVPESLGAERVLAAPARG